MERREMELLQRLYDRFNARDIEAVLAVLHEDVLWANGWEGGHVAGHEEVRRYWTRQWASIDPHVEPMGFSTGSRGEIVAEVCQHLPRSRQIGVRRADVVSVAAPQREAGDVRRKLLPQTPENRVVSGDGCGVRGCPFGDRDQQCLDRSELVVDASPKLRCQVPRPAACVSGMIAVIARVRCREERDPRQEHRQHQDYEALSYPQRRQSCAKLCRRLAHRQIIVHAVACSETNGPTERDS